MRDTLTALCNTFIENRDTIKSSFGWENAYMYPVCAAIFTHRRQVADERQIMRCQGILKEKTGVLSNFRGTARLAMIAMLAVDQDPEGRMERALEVYSALKEHFFTSEYLPVASMMIADVAVPSQYHMIAARTRRIYDLMKKEHPFLTSGEDSVFAAMLALSDMTDEQVSSEAESCYNILESEFFSGNAVQSLSHVLALGRGTAPDKCRRAMALYHGLKDNGFKYGTGYELATLGVLSMLPEDLAVVRADIMETDGFLSGQKGYGVFGIGRKQRLMHAGMLVSCDYTGQNTSMAMNSAAISGTVSMIAAQQAAMCAAIAASAAASASSSD